MNGAVVQLASLFSRLDLFKVWKILVTSVGTSIRANGTASLRLTWVRNSAGQRRINGKLCWWEHNTSLRLYSGRRRSDLDRIHYRKIRMIQTTPFCPKWHPISKVFSNPSYSFLGFLKVVWFWGEGRKMPVPGCKKTLGASFLRWIDVGLSPNR